MNQDRIIQACCGVVAAASVTAGGLLLPSILKEAEESTLRYTNNAVEGAPDWVNTLGMSIGALRGLIVDYLWIKVNRMKDEGQFYEVMADADLITKLQPRFPHVWVFHAHNMSYNVSVATNTLEERWEWVNAGIRLLREKGLRANPNDMVLHKELSFFFAHKLDGHSDDAHMYYKRKFAEEWNGILGRPKDSWDDRTAAMKEIADAPRSIAEADEVSPGVKELARRLEEELGALHDGSGDVVGTQLLRDVARREAILQYSTIARELGVEGAVRSGSPYFNALDERMLDPALAENWPVLLATLRKQVLKDEYNMDPELMYEYTRDLGPLDWRHPQSHALYWARRGAKAGAGRYDTDDIYKVINTDRMQLQALQALARTGRISFDPFSSEVPGRFPDPRFIDAITGDDEREGIWEQLYRKHYAVRGAGGDTFNAFLRNFLGSAVREWYRQGEQDRAQALLDHLDEYFGSGASPPNNAYAIPLDAWVKNQTLGAYERQPLLAVSDVASSLRYGFRMGIGQDRPDVYREALQYADQVTQSFKTNDYNNYVTKFGTGRIADIIGALESSAQIAFEQLMTDPMIPIEERIAIWSGVDELEPGLRPRVYDRIEPSLRAQYRQNPLSRKVPFEQAFASPPGLEEWRRRIAAEKARQRENASPESHSDPITRQ
jgi:hypothetical protein